MPADVGSLRRLGLVALVAAGFLLVAGVALAYWSSAGTGTASASTGTLNAPTAVSASGVGSVAVTWTGSTGTTAPQGYYVVRTRTSDGVTAPACGTSRTTLTSSSSTSCTDPGVPAGTFTYAVSAVVGGWTATSASSASLTIASTGLLSFTSQPSGGTAGTTLATQPTVTMKNSDGTVQNEAGAVTIVLTDPGSGTLTCTSTSTTKSAVAGVATFAGCSVNRSGTYTMTATSAGKTSIASSTFTITAAAASKVAFTMQPGGGTSQTAWAAQPEVTVQDAFGNTVTGNTSSVTLALTTPGGALLSCTGGSSKAAVAGIVTFAGCKVDKAGSYTLTATDGSLTSATSTTFAITAGATTKLVFTTQPGGSSSGVPLATQPVVTLQDAYGNTAIGDTSSVTLALTSAGGATLSCTANPKPATAGVATFAGCKVNRPGTFTLLATDGSLTSATSSSFVIAAGAAAQLTFTTQPGTGTGGSALATQPVVAVQDAGGNTVATDTSLVTLALTTPGGATLTCTPNNFKAAVAGVATFAGCKVDKVGTYTLTATDGSLTSATSSSFTVTVGAAAKVAFTTQPGNGVSQSALGTQPVVSVQDAGGNTVTTSTSSVTLALTTPATLACTANPKAAAAGVAAFAGCQVDKVGSYTLTASATGLTAATSSSFTVTVGAAAKVVFTTQPGNGVSQSALGTQPVVTVQDAGGNTVTTDTSSVTLTLTTPGGGSLACTANPKAAVAGVATFAGCKVDKSGTYTLTATDGALATGASSSFTITAGAASQLRYVTSAAGTTASCPTGGVTVGNGGSLTTYVAILDAFGNLTTAPATATAITLTKVAGGGGNPPSPASLTVLANASPAVTSGSSVFKLPNGNQAATTYTATSGSLASTSCTISR